MSINSITGNTMLTSGSFPPARAATTGANINLQTIGLGTVDGVALVAGDRVLVKDQTDATTNGIYAASTGTWARTSDAAGNQQFFSGMAVTVALGAVNAGLTYICTTTDDPVIVGTSLITFAAQSTVATATQSATSTTSLTIGTGSKTLTIAAGKAFQVNQEVLVYETSNTANSMLGQVTAYTGTSLTVNVTNTAGSGTHADWTVVLYGSAAAAGITPPIGVGNVTGPGSSTAGHIATFADGTGKVIQDGGVVVGGANTITPSMFANAAISLGATMLNGTIVPSVAGNALTLAIKTLAGADPSPNDPVFFVFRSATPASGSYSVIEVTAALSTTVPASSTLGFQNATPGRAWLVAVNNAGTVSLAVINCLSVTGSPPTAVSTFPLAGFDIGNIVAYGGGANSAQVLYGVGTLSSVPYSVLGFVTWEAGSTLATAGTWNLTPTRTELYRPGVPLPGSEVQHQFLTNASTVNNSTTAFVSSNLTQAITPSSSANIIEIEGAGLVQASGVALLAVTTQLQRNSTGIGQALAIQNPTVSTNTQAAVPAGVLDAPFTLNSVTYAQFFKSSSGGSNVSHNGGTLLVRELQG